MKRRVWAMLLSICIILSFTACNKQALEDAELAVDAYQIEANLYNEKVDTYNSAVAEIKECNAVLDGAVNAAQDMLNNGETPFDENTMVALKDAIKTAVNEKIPLPEELPSYPVLSVDENAKKSELESITLQATNDTEVMKSYVFPDLPLIPDYHDIIELLSNKKDAYIDSVQALKQITAPSDKFVIERLQSIETITAIEAVTEDHDPNGKLNKQGGYIGCIYFSDSNVNRENLYIEAEKDNVIDIGCDGGGAIEIFHNVKDAQNRDTYLSSFDGTMFSSGSHYVYGTLLIRTSDKLTGTQQLELTEQIVQALTLVKH